MKQSNSNDIIVEETSDLTKQVMKFYNLFSKIPVNMLFHIDVKYSWQRSWGEEILLPETYSFYFPSEEDGFEINVTCATRKKYKNLFHRFLDFWFDIDYSFNEIKFGAKIEYLGKEINGLYNKLCILEKAYAYKKQELTVLEERINSKIAEYVPRPGEVTPYDKGLQST